MTRQKKIAIIFIVTYIALFYSWLLIFENYITLFTIGASLFPAFGGVIAIYWFARKYPIFPSEHKRFIILINTGLLLHVLSNFLWFIIFITSGEFEFPMISYYMWLSSYAVFLVSLFYKLELLYKSVSIGTLIFNIIIFMISAITLSFHFLIQPIITISIENQSNVFINFLYPILDIGILYATLNIFYITRHKELRKGYFFLSLGFLIQIIADIFYAYLLINHQYINGSLIDPLWCLSILVIGYSSLYLEEKKEDEVWTFKSTFTHVDNGLLLYGSVILLAALVTVNTFVLWNTLIFGLVLTIFVLIIRQIAMIKSHRRLVDQLWYHAYYDKLTGLLNRTSFLQDIEDLIHFSNKKGKTFGIMLLDFDRFKNINDTLGHSTGDLLLKECAKILHASISKFDRVYRLGGDEFIILLQGANEAYCKQIAEMILLKFSKALNVAQYKIFISPSIGISLFPNHGKTSEVLFKNADTSMYLAKSKGKNQYRFYTPELFKMISRRMLIENELSVAIPKQQLTLYYQPKVNLRTKKIIGMEALIRWNHPVLGQVSPLDFIPIAEETGQIISIGDWVLYEACRQLKAWQEKGYGKLLMCVNVSVRQFQHKDFIKSVKEILKQTEVDPRDIELEITESIMRNLEDSSSILTELKNLGMKISIDDFGTGYSSLSVLKTLPFDAIKIDQLFIKELSETDIVMVKTIMNIGFNLNLTVVIEGIEKEEQVQTLLQISDKDIIGQGYLFSKPIPAEDFEHILQRSRGKLS